MQNAAEQEELELELPEGEVDNSEADVSLEAVEEAPTEEVQEEEPRLSAEDRLKKMMEDDDELREYGDGVQKRIDKLTYKYREAERREQAALEYARGVQAQLDAQKQQNQQQDQTLFTEYTNRIDTQLEQAKAQYKAAFDSGDPDALAEANAHLARLSVEQENLRRVKTQRERAAEQPVSQQQYQQPQQPQAPARPDPRAEEWAEKNSWFGEDEAMTYAAFGIHRNLVERERVDPSSDAYYTELDKRMREAFPHKFQQSNRPVQTVASASRGNAKQGGRNKVKLSPSEIAIANRLGVPLEEYAKYVKR